MNKLTRVSTYLLVALVVLSLPLSTVFAAASEPGRPAAATKAQTDIYIVQMLDKPIAAYDGGVAGITATKPNTGQKLDVQSEAAVDYAAYLEASHDEVLEAVGGGRKIYDYKTSFNGFAAELTPEAAGKLALRSDVLLVSKNELVSIDTSSTPSFLGLTEPGGLWDQLGGMGRGGEDVVIGIVDSGIWAENPSFSDRTGTGGKENRRPEYYPLPGWDAPCVAGEAFKSTLCNNKLIAAQYFNESWGGNAGINAQRPWEYNSPRDYNGHGSHTASTAGGNYYINPAGPGLVFGRISGIAPRARLSVYKALWSTQDGSTASGFTADLVAAVDTAVADGVDVINYSISGSTTSFLVPVMVSFLYAADAGVFVATSAGNSGPTYGTVAHAGPWVTTVAAGTHNRSGQGSVTLGDGSTFYGASVARAVTAPFIDAETAGLPGADPTQVRLCYSTIDTGGFMVLDPAKVAGKIVLCDRGVTARVNKSLAVQEAGGVGVILTNTSASSLNADFHFVPTVHLADTDRPAVKAYAATPGATATIHAATITYDTPAPFTASFSSRGPLAASGDVLKPDVMAPGQDILAAVAPPGNHGLKYNLYSGTSMSSPHVAGVAALLKDLHPDWSPMAIKSAMMTSAGDILDGANTSILTIFKQGAGHIRPNSAADPGLVYDSNIYDWFAFLCGATTGVSPSTCAFLESLGYSLDPSDLNQASIAIGALAGTQTVTRTVTNVDDEPATYAASYTGLDGIAVDFNPASFTIDPGATQTYTITFTRTTAPLNAYASGQLTWSDGEHFVRSPMVIVPVALSAPAAVFGAGEEISYAVAFGYDGAFSATARGLVAATLTPGTVADDPTDSACSLSSPNAQLIPVTIPAGTTYARFSLFDADVNPGSDMDMCVFRGTTLVGSSGSGTSAEEVNLLNPVAADYTVVVQGWGVVDSSPFVLHTWLLDASDAGNMIVTAPAAAVLGTSGTISLSFSGLMSGVKYLGSVAYAGEAGLPDPTIVRVDMP